VAERPSKSFLFLYEAVLQVKNSLNRGRNKFVELNKVPLSLVIRFESYSSDCSLRIPWSIELKFDDRHQFQVVNEDIGEWRVQFQVCVFPDAEYFRTDKDRWQHPDPR
jgi:hypothetical protein